MYELPSSVAMTSSVAQRLLRLTYAYILWMATIVDDCMYDGMYELPKSHLHYSTPMRYS